MEFVGFHAAEVKWQHARKRKSACCCMVGGLSVAMVLSLGSFQVSHPCHLNPDPGNQFNILHLKSMPILFLV